MVVVFSSVVLGISCFSVWMLLWVLLVVMFFSILFMVNRKMISVVFLVVLMISVFSVVIVIRFLIVKGDLVCKVCYVCCVIGVMLIR